MVFMIPLLIDFLNEAPNGLRYPLVGETRQRHFDGANSKPRKTPENAPRTHLSTARIVSRTLVGENRFFTASILFATKLTTLLIKVATFQS
jgi:hypothetical protein